MGLRPGTSTAAYIRAVNEALGTNSPWQATPPDGGKFYAIASSLVSLLALMVAVAAGLGVLNTVLMSTRDRVHDLGIYKALGMRPGQVLTMVVCWIAGPAVLAAAIAAPAAVALNTATIRAMAGTAHTGIPASFTQVFPPSRLALLSLAALAIAVAGALLPASWAARDPAGRGAAYRMNAPMCAVRRGHRRRTAGGKRAARGGAGNRRRSARPPGVRRARRCGPSGPPWPPWPPGGVAWVP